MFFSKSHSQALKVDTGAFIVMNLVLGGNWFFSNAACSHNTSGKVWKTFFFQFVVAFSIDRVLKKSKYKLSRPIYKHFDFFRLWQILQDDEVLSCSLHYCHIIIENKVSFFCSSLILIKTNLWYTHGVNNLPIPAIVYYLQMPLIVSSVGWAGACHQSCMLKTFFIKL